MASAIFTVANQLTLLRMVFIPFFLLSIWESHYGWALAIFIIAGLTDTLDGVLARWLQQKTSLGAYLDPIADKLLLSSSFFVLALKGDVRWWLTILVLGRDVLIITIAVVLIVATGRRPFPPSIYGKACTVAQVLAVFLVLLTRVRSRPFFEMAEVAAIYLAAALTLISGLHYAITYSRHIVEAERG